LEAHRDLLSAADLRQQVQPCGVARLHHHRAVASLAVQGDVLARIDVQQVDWRELDFVERVVRLALAELRIRPAALPAGQAEVNILQ